MNEPMERLLIATTNPAKLAEYKLILRDIGIELELLSLAEVGISETPEETGATFTENALLKARTGNRRARRGAGSQVASMAQFRRRRFRRGAGCRSHPPDEGRRGGAPDGANASHARVDS
jgi:hypothetical protein